MRIKHNMSSGRYEKPLSQPSRPFRFWMFFSASSNNPARWITTSFPKNAVILRLHWEPELFHWVKDENHPPQNLQLLRPALSPPRQWRTALVSCASRPPAFPLPSLTGCPPSTRVTRFPPGCSLGRPQSPWTRRMPPGWSRLTPWVQRHEKSPKRSGAAGSVWTGLLCKFMFESLNIKYKMKIFEKITLGNTVNFLIWY